MKPDQVILLRLDNGGLRVAVVVSWEQRPDGSFVVVTKPHP